MVVEGGKLGREEGKRREEKGREGKRREEKGREGKRGREGRGVYNPN